MNFQRQELIKERIKDCIREKFQSYKPETDKKPFHYRLLGKDRMELYSFIQSLNTTFGVSIYEPVAVELARGRFKVVDTQVQTYDQISTQAQRRIQTIMDGLETADTDPNKPMEIKKIREVCQTGTFDKVKPTQVDIWLEKDDGEMYLIDLKTVKPNKGNFRDYKRTLLVWAATELARNSDVIVNTMIGIPYNPYEPKSYKRWTMKGMLDFKHDILIAEELWDFIGGEGTYTELLDAFEEAGIELRDEIDEYFKQFS